MTDENRSESSTTRTLPEHVLPDRRIPLHLRRIGAPVAWVGGYRGEGAKVAVVDSGIDNREGASRRHLGDYPSNEPLIVNERWDADRDLYEHQRVLYGGVLTPGREDRTEQQQKDYAFVDEYGHGTKMAGIIAARPGFDGVMGVAPRARIYNYKVTDEDGIVEPGVLLSAGRRVAADQPKTGVRVALIALDELLYEHQDPLHLEKVLKDMAAARILVVMAAGDHPRAGECLDDVPMFPGHYGIENLLVVTAHDGAEVGDEKLIRYSNWGKKTVHLAACGRCVPSVAPTTPVAVYGTSAAAAVVAGAAALVAGRFPEKAAADLCAEVLKLSRPVLDLRHRTLTGGALDLSRLPGLAGSGTAKA